MSTSAKYLMISASFPETIAWEIEKATPLIKTTTTFQRQILRSLLQIAATYLNHTEYSRFCTHLHSENWFYNREIQIIQYGSKKFCNRVILDSTNNSNINKKFFHERSNRKNTLKVMAAMKRWQDEYLSFIHTRKKIPFSKFGIDQCIFLDRFNRVHCFRHWREVRFVKLFSIWQFSVWWLNRFFSRKYDTCWVSFENSWIFALFFSF